MVFTFFFSDISLQYFFTNYTYQFSIFTYDNGSGFSFEGLKAFEQVIINNEATYYVLDSVGVVISFDRNWTFKRTYLLPGTNSLSTNKCFSLKFVLDHFFIACLFNLYKANPSFSEFSSNLAVRKDISIYGYYGLNYDYSSSLLYAVSYYNHCIDVFNTSLAYLHSISLDESSKPFSINQFNGKFYIGLSSSQILVLQNNVISSIYNISSCEDISSIYFDTNGDMAMTCYLNHIAYVYNFEGVSHNINISTSIAPTYLAVDSMGRMVVLSAYQIDIYY